MAVVEYKNHVVGFRGEHRQPMWIREPGHYRNPDDHTIVGWIPDNAEYYIPDSLVTLTKEELVQRQLGIVANHPERIYVGDKDELWEQEEDTENWRNKTDAEVRAEVEAWYDEYVVRCQEITE